MGNNGNKWREEHETELRALAGSGSARDIAERLNEVCGTTFSRNAIIGKMGRMGLHWSAQASPPVRSVPKPLPLQRPTPKSLSAAVSAKPMPYCEAVEPRYVRLDELTLSCCRWPFGDRAPYTFCGLPRFIDRATGTDNQSFYCLQHLMMSIGHGTQSERDAARLSERHLGAGRGTP